MRRSLLIVFLIFALFSPLFSVKSATASNLQGRILLQVESKGEAWYVNPKDGQRYYMSNGSDAYNVMKSLGIGISNKNLDKIKTDANYRKKFIGKIFLQVESKGEAYYISFDGRYNYLKDGAAAYAVMRKLGLGIKNSDLSKIPLSNKDKNRTDSLLSQSSNTPAESSPKAAQSTTITTDKSMTAKSTDEQGTVFSTLSFYFTAESDTAFKISAVSATDYDSYIGGSYFLQPGDHALLSSAVISVQYTDAAVSLYKQRDKNFDESDLTLAYFDNDLFRYVKIDSDFNKTDKTVTAVINKLHGGGIVIKQVSGTITESEAANIRK
ncbi:MAG: hypothetical protein WCW61_02060 [Patescibacteria group bacterium]|jgi:hypothetical protein